MNRFFLSPSDQIDSATFRISSPDIIHQMRNVLRLKSGDQVVLIGQQGVDYIVSIGMLSRDLIEGTVVTKQKNTTESAVHLRVYVPLLKHRERFEFMLQKLTEIGVSEIIPCISVRTNRSTLPRRDRLERILKEAAEQSGRGVIPLLGSETTFNSTLVQSIDPHQELRCIIHPTASSHLRDLQYKKDTTNITLFIGPEGGFSSEEFVAATDAGVSSFHLGPRILRAETASMIASAFFLIF